MKFEGSIPDLPTNMVLTRKSSEFDNGHWLFPEQMGGKEHIGFIYVVRDNYLKRFYLGKKQFYSKAKVSRGVEENWREYATSSKILKEMFKERPRSEFEFICLEQYKTAGTVSYSETWTLCLVEAPTNKMWYNTRIEKVSWPVKEPVTERHKARLNATLSFCDMRNS